MCVKNRCLRRAARGDGREQREFTTYLCVCFSGLVLSQGKLKLSQVMYCACAFVHDGCERNYLHSQSAVHMFVLQT